MIGFLFRPTPWLSRLGLLVGGIGLIIPHQIGGWATWIDVAGAIVGGAFVLYERNATRRALPAPAVAPATKASP
jgi:hypothetical protein